MLGKLTFITYCHEKMPWQAERDSSSSEVNLKWRWNLQPLLAFLEALSRHFEFWFLSLGVRDVATYMTTIFKSFIWHASFTFCLGNLGTWKQCGFLLCLVCGQYLDSHKGKCIYIPSVVKCIVSSVLCTT